MTKLHQLAEKGQGIWLDYIRRSFIESGELKAWIDKGLRGETSNPSIFDKAIAGSTDYDDDLHRLVEAGKSTDEIYETLAVEDIQSAADAFREVYEETEGRDGYVSIEVSPNLANDTKGTLREARRLFQKTDRPNIMVKVPATEAGIPAIQTLIGEGRNINVTLMFSQAQYDAVAEAFIAGLEELAKNRDDLSKVASVASFFVSRVDTKVDQRLDEIGESEIRGKIGVANAKIAYQRFKEVFSGPRWEYLAKKGAQVQRVLWASTSVKDPAYPDTMYVENLIGPDTVNTLPLETIRVTLDHGTVQRTLDRDVDEAKAHLKRLSDLGIELDEITDELLEEGVEKFAKSFESLMDSIEKKRDRLLAGWAHQEASLGEYQAIVDDALEELTENKIISRIWDHDHTVWKDDPAEITNRLGWLNIAGVMEEKASRIQGFAEDVRAEGYKDVLLLGMGGSSLAPELFSKVFGRGGNSLNLEVLDSTDPSAVQSYADRFEPKSTLYIVSSKSGTTVETLSFFKYFYNQATKALGEAQAGDHFIAITDPGSKLAGLAKEYHFRAAFINDPNIGGRYSALSYFGLVPAALAGVDVPRLLDRALAMASGCHSCVKSSENPGAWLGVIMGELAKAGRDKLTLVPSTPLISFGDWVEQLIAESTGKEGKGILPVAGQSLSTIDRYQNDRVFIHLRLDEDDTMDAAFQALEQAGHPIVRFHLHNEYDLGGQFFLWELAVAVAGYRLGINPFNQPNVESAKIRAKEMVRAYREQGYLPRLKPAFEQNGFVVYGNVTVNELGEALKTFLSSNGGAPMDVSTYPYLAIQAYVQPTEETTAALQELRTKIQDDHKLATTVGYGPRFLHSTGQLHKGDSGNGLFLQFTTQSENDIPIPDEVGSSASSISFGVLKLAQALGDRQALLDAGRRVLRIHIKEKPIEKIRELISEI